MPVATLPAATAPAAVPARAVSEERVVAAALRCIARWGVSKTTLDDIAREAGISRASVYRVFPGGKEGLLEGVAQAEVRRYFAAVVERMAAAGTLEDALVAGIVEGGRRIVGHAALRFLLAHEPEAVLPRLAFAKLDEVLRAASYAAGPTLERWLDRPTALRTAEWAGRLVLSYACTPGDVAVDIADEPSVRRLVRAFVLPGLVPRGST
jgi:AcrR family transcriptional regulator